MLRRTTRRSPEYGRTRRRASTTSTACPSPASSASRARASSRPLRPLVGDLASRRRHRPRRAVVVHHLRRLRRAVPGRHRAHRPHRRHAPLPGADRVRVPVRGRRRCCATSRTRATRGAWPTAAASEWFNDLSFEVRQADPGTKLDADIEYLFWVGCAGALEDRSKKVTVAFAELLHTAGVEFAVLGQGESCTGDPARRLGNEFLFQMQGMQNVETLNSITRAEPLKIVATCPHCFNTLANEYPQLGGHYEVVHHTQLLGKLVDEGKLDPGRAGRQERHLPRPVLPRPAQQGLHAAARGARRHPGPQSRGDAPLQGPRLLLRRRRRAVLDGGEDRQADQRRAHRRGARPGPGRHLHRLPVLHPSLTLPFSWSCSPTPSRPRSARARPARTSPCSTSRSCCASRSAPRRRQRPPRTPQGPPGRPGRGHGRRRVELTPSGPRVRHEPLLRRANLVPARVVSLS